MPAAKKTEHSSFAAAIAAAQLEMCNATKNAKNPHFKTNYADLSAVRDVVVPAFNRNGIAILQPVDGTDGFCTVRTVLLWTDQTLEVGNCTLPIGNSRNVAQAVGGVATYLRRYQLASVGGIAQEDDDAQSYQAPKPKPRQVQQRQQQPQRKERPGPKWEKGPPCPDCAKPANVDINYRAWFKAQDNLPDDVKNRPALWCDDWKACGWKLWTTDEAQTFIQQASASTFDDGLTAAGGA